MTRFKVGDKVSFNVTDFVQGKIYRGTGTVYSTDCSLRGAPALSIRTVGTTCMILQSKYVKKIKKGRGRRDTI